MEQYFDLPRTREYATAINAVQYFTAEMCKNGHTSPRYVKDGRCVECHNIATTRYESDPAVKARRAEQRRARRNKNKKAARSKSNEYRRNNPEVIKRHQQRYYQHNKTNIQQRNAEYYQANASACKATMRKYQAAKQQALPAWYDHQEYIELIEWRDYLNDTYGCNLVIDHIDPIQGKHVCGLHCTANLQLITAEMNARKSNTEGWSTPSSTKRYSSLYAT